MVLLKKHGKLALLLTFVLVLVALPVLTIDVFSVNSLYDIDDAIVFDLAMGNVSFTDASYSGTDADGNAVSGTHQEDNIYVVTQTNSATATNNVVSVGTTSTAVTKKFEIHLRDLNVEAPKSTSNHAPAIYVNTDANTVYLILDNGTSSKLKAYAQIFTKTDIAAGATGTIADESKRFGHAAIEKEVELKGSTNKARGTLVVTCEQGYAAYLGGSTHGHDCSSDGHCGALNAQAFGQAGFSSKSTRTGAAAAIGSRADVSLHNRGSLVESDIAGTLYNLIIAGGKITAKGATGNYNKNVEGNDGVLRDVYLGGSPGIGVGAGFQQYTVGYAAMNICITGGYINSIAGDGSSANIGGGYHAGHVEVKIYGGTIFATEQMTNTNDMKRGAGIGGGGGGATSNATAGASVYIYGGNITAKSSYGAAIGAGAGGTNGQAKDATVVIEGGTINATTTKGADGYGAGAAIGAGGSLGEGKGGQATVEIKGGTIVASSAGGADIGGGGTNSTNSSAVGGKGNVTISGGTITASVGGIGGGRANAGRGGDATVTISGGTIYASAIGGGDSTSKAGGKASVTVSGNAYIELSGVIGGGNSSGANGGEAVVTVNGGYMECNGIGGGSSNSANGGAATLVVTDGTLIARSIGGGASVSGKIGYAKATISGGEITGQFIMAQGSDTPCTFTMTGGHLHGVDATSGEYVKRDGGAIYMDDPNGVAELSGGTISNCTADNGGAIYMTAGQVTLSGSGIIELCSAIENGGAIYMGGGTFRMTGGTITGNTSENGAGTYLKAGTMSISGGSINKNVSRANGGAAYLGGGDLTVSGGMIIDNKAVNGAGAYLSDGTMLVSGGTLQNNVSSQDGGGAYLAGGSFTVNGGEILENTAVNGGGALVANGSVTVKGGTIADNKAAENGGAFSITNGNYTMIGGLITRNQAINGNGGAIYVSSSMDDSNIVIRSGSIVGNSAGASGGALGVYGQDGVEFTITIGSNTYHPNQDDTHVCADDGDLFETCPVIKQNVSAVSGGGIYLAGSYAAVMNMYCLVEGENKVGDGVSASNFMKVEGGTLNISSLGDNDESDYGNVVINSSIHVTGGKVTLQGSVSNPMFKDSVTVDVDTSQGSTFIDERKGDDIRTIQYFENFERNGKISGQYTLIDVTTAEAHVIRASMYFNVGYVVDGWLLMVQDSEGNLVPSGTVYTAGDKAQESGNLIFYAKWVAVGYTVVYTPGVDSYNGSMEPQDFAYSDEKALTSNAFVNIGYVFSHWVDAADPSKTYIDGAIVSGLSDVHGAEITLVAVWSICDHNGTIYTLETTETSVSRECSCLGYKETASLSGIVTVYDTTSHGLTVTYKRDTLNGLLASEKWNFIVYYNGTSNGNDALNDSESAPVDAGSYTGSIKVSNEVVITVPIVINRADRTESPNAPTYSTAIDTLDSNYYAIVVHDPEDPTNNPIEYRFSWYEGTELMQSEWLPWDVLNPPAQRLLVTYTNYYVDVRYAQDCNYNASEIVRGTSVIVWTGNVTFKFTSAVGLSHSHVANSDGIDGIVVTLEPLSGYYIYEIRTNVTAIAGYTLPQMNEITRTSDLWEIWIHDIQAAAAEGVTIEITFSGAERVVTVESSATKNESFDNIKAKGEDTVSISRDSAFTTYFKVEHFHHYLSAAITFNRVLPSGSTVIMIDHADGSYWSYTVSSEATTLPLANFVRMGTADEKYAVGARTSLELQFVVNFADCDTTPALGDIVISFTATPDQPADIQTVPAMPTGEQSISRVTLVEEPRFSINKGSSGEDALTQSVSYQYAVNSGAEIGMSRWDAVRGILLVQPLDGTILPADAKLQVKIGDTTEIYSMINGVFVVSLPTQGSGVVWLTLLSDMLPNANSELELGVQLWVSSTGVRTTPFELIVSEAVVLTYTITEQVKPALHAEITGALPQFDGTTVTPLNFSVYVNSLPQNYSVKATLYGKNANGGYTSTTQTMNLNVTSDQLDVTLDLTAFKEVMNQSIGSLSLMLRVEILDSNGKSVEFVPMYFVLVDGRQ